MHSRKRIIAPILLVLISGGVLVAWYFNRAGATSGGPLQASGTVEAVDVIIAPELAGRVAEVPADKGQVVKAGEAVLRLDDTLLQSQRQRSAAALQAARVNLSGAEIGVKAAEAAQRSAQASADAAQSSAQAELVAARQSLDDLYKNADVARSEMQKQVATANHAVRDAQYQLDNFTIPSNQEKLSATQAISDTQQKLDKARAAFEPYRDESSGNTTREDLKDALDEAQSDYDTAIRRYELETALLQTQSRLDKAQKDLAKLQNGPDPDKVAQLEARIAAILLAPKPALDAVEQANVGRDQAQSKLAQAQAAAAQAQADLDVIDAQIQKLTVYAPGDGVVLSRNIEPGEVVQVGAPVMTLGKLDELKITVYIPEDQYGLIKLGDQVRVTADSFPGEQFTALVNYIADQAEFTPRNVQTGEGRKTTVFAVELVLRNPDGRLKPGMPADVCFNCR
jgi:HlyD family secretion protein